jgi:HEAT repeat protein
LHKQLVTILIDRDVSLQIRAIQSLGRMGAEAKAAMPVVLFAYGNAVNSADYVTRSNAFVCLETIAKIAPDDPRSINAVLDALATVPLPTPGKAVKGAKGAKGGIGLATGGLGQRASVIRLAMQMKIEPKRLVPALVSAINDPACTVQAINALGEIGGEAIDAVPILTKLKLDPNQSVREAAKKALSNIEK